MSLVGFIRTIDHVFALCHLLGYRFAPRLRNLQDRRLAIIGAKPRYKILEPLLGRPIRVDVIEENWEDIVRLAASLSGDGSSPHGRRRCSTTTPASGLVGRGVDTARGRPCALGSSPAPLR